MVVLGYAAMMEQFTPTQLLDYCEKAEKAGFPTVMASDHFHPWVPEQGQSGFSYCFMASLGERTNQRFGPGVVCPSFRFHPAIVAHMASTLEHMYPGRTYLGLGAGEALNEHIVGGVWPEAGVRSAMMFEAVEIIKKLFTGEVVRHEGKYFTLESAKLYTNPDTPPPIYVATAGPVNAQRTGRYTDGMITVGASDEKINGLFQRFEKGAQQEGKDPAKMAKLLQVHVSWAKTVEAATDNAVREWPNGGMAFPKADIKNPEDFQAMAKLVRPENYVNRVFISNDPKEHLTYIQKYADFGFDEIYVHNVGRNQEEFIEVYGEHVVPHVKAKA
jgi:G6PDH family F420-dependent oxidoreductase